MTHQDFIVAYLGSTTHLEVSAKTGLDTHKVANTASALRRHGVLLPIKPHKPGFNRKRSPFSDPLDVDALNKFITER